MTNWRHHPAIRIRPLPEANVCLVYTGPNHRPAPMLHGLNLSMWFLMSLCDGRDEAAILADYATETGDQAGANALLKLEHDGIITREHPP